MSPERRRLTSRNVSIFLDVVRTYHIHALLCTALLTSCGPAELISGRARIVDGDSLAIGTASIRLFGVDAPEGRQTCGRDGVSWRCGEAARDELARLVGDNAVTCERRDTDRYGRTVAVCTSGGVDLSAELARAGLALAYRQYSSDYVDEEAEAKAAGRGVWAGEFTAPWDFRRSEPSTGRALPTPDPTAPGNCRIKGNINRDGERIYHVPGSASYEATVLDVTRGERWFCSEQEARSAGWRAPRGPAR